MVSARAIIYRQPPSSSLTVTRHKHASQFPRSCRDPLVTSGRSGRPGRL